MSDSIEAKGASLQLSANRLREYVSYDQNTGIFSRRRSVRGHAISGSIGYVNQQGYIQISIYGKRFQAHRLAWLYVHGEFPSGVIDHIDGNKTNNAIINLRDTSRFINGQNIRKANASNLSSGVLGVSKRGDRWRAQIWVSGTNREIGVFDAPEEAHAAYLEAKRRLHPGCTI